LFVHEVVPEDEIRQHVVKLQDLVEQNSIDESAHTDAEQEACGRERARTGHY
jgi:hypothetical protein